MFIKKMTLTLLTLGTSLSFTTIQTQDSLKFDGPSIKEKFISPGTKKHIRLQKEYGLKKNLAVLNLQELSRNHYIPLTFDTNLKAWFIAFQKGGTATYVTIPLGFSLCPNQDDRQYYYDYFGLIGGKKQVGSKQKFLWQFYVQNHIDLLNDKNYRYKANICYRYYQKGGTRICVLFFYDDIDHSYKKSNSKS